MEKEKKEKTFCIRAKHDPVIPIHNLIKHVLLGLFEVEFMPRTRFGKVFPVEDREERVRGESQKSISSQRHRAGYVGASAVGVQEMG